jgi:hypothetical protein
MGPRGGVLVVADILKGGVAERAAVVRAPAA